MFSSHRHRSFMQPTATVFAVLAMLVLPSLRASAQLGGILTEEAARTARVTLALETAPADASIVFVVPNPAELSKKIAKLNKDLGLNVPELADALGSIKTQAGITEGVNDDGVFLVVLHDLSELKDNRDAFRDKEPPFTVHIPVSDYAKFVGNFEGDATAEVTRLKLPEGEDGYARKVGNFAVMGPDEAVVKGYKPGGAAKAMLTSAGKFGRERLISNDISVMASIANMRPWLKPLAEEGIAEMKKELDREFGSAVETAGPFEKQIMAVARVAILLYADAAMTLIEDADVFVGGSDMSDAGFGFTYAAQLRPGSPTAKMFAGGGNAGPTLAKLPKRNYLTATAWNAQGIDTKAMVDKINAALTGGELKDSWIANLVATSLPLAADSKVGGQAVYLPSAGGGGMGMMGMAAGFPTLSILETSDPAAYKAQYQKMLKQVGDIKIDLPAMPGPTGEMQEGAVTFKTDYKANAIEIDGAKVDQFMMQLELPANITAAMAGEPQMAMIVGMASQPTNGYLATKGKHILMTQTLDAALLSEGLNALDRADGLGTDSLINAVRKQLPEKPVMEAYFNLGGLVNLFGPMAAMFGMPPIVAPADMQPLGGAIAVEDGAIVGRGYVPMGVVTFVKDTAMGIMGAMGGGMGGPGGGGGEMPPGF